MPSGQLPCNILWIWFKKAKSSEQSHRRPLHPPSRGPCVNQHPRGQPRMGGASCPKRLHLVPVSSLTGPCGFLPNNAYVFSRYSLRGGSPGSWLGAEKEENQHRYRDCKLREQGNPFGTPLETLINNDLRVRPRTRAWHTGQSGATCYHQGLGRLRSDLLVQLSLDLTKRKIKQKETTFLYTYKQSLNQKGKQTNTLFQMHF